MHKSEHIITSKHYLIICASAFVFGVFISLVLGTFFAFILSVFYIYVCFCTFIIMKTFQNFNFRKKHILLTLAILVFFVLGIVRVFFIDFASQNSLKKYSGQELWLYGTICSEPELTQTKHYYTFEFDVFQAGNNGSVNETIIVYSPKDHGCNFHTGDNVFFWASLKEPYTSENSSGYDYLTSLRSKNIFLTASTKNINPLNDYKHFSFISALKHTGSTIRSKISNAIKQLFPNDPTASAILRGILIGDKSGFDDELYDKFSNAGISHIVAVSGLHLSILFSFFMIFLGTFPVNRRILLLITVPFILIFIASSSFSPSLSRASIMLLIMIFSCLINEEYHPVTALFAALSLIVAVAPYSILSKSLVLSFSATFGIFVYFNYINKFLTMPFKSEFWNKTIIHRFSKRASLYVLSSLSLSISSLLGTAYFLILFFSKLSKVQFLTNLWIIPLVSAIFCLGYVSCIIFYICPWLSLNILKYPLSWCIEIVKLTITVFGDSRFAYNYSLPSKASSHAAIYFGGALMLYMFLKAFNDIYEQKELSAKKRTYETD